MDSLICPTGQGIPKIIRLLADPWSIVILDNPKCENVTAGGAGFFRP
jgi:hypothetical protein